MIFHLRNLEASRHRIGNRRELILNYQRGVFLGVVNLAAFFRCYYCNRCHASYVTQSLLEHHTCVEGNQSEILYPGGVWKPKKTIVDELAELSVPLSPEDASKLLHPHHFAVITFKALRLG